MRSLNPVVQLELRVSGMFASLKLHCFPHLCTSPTTVPFKGKDLSDDSLQIQGAIADT